MIIMMRRGLDCLLLLQLALSSQRLVTTHGFSPTTKIQVCQNKDCCQRFEGSSSTDLVRTLQDLLPSHDGDGTVVVVESSGCLSQCGKGPNISVQQASSSSTEPPLLVHGVRDAIRAATELELSCSVPVHSTLLAAVKVLEKAEQVTTAEEKLKFLNSVIKKLSSMEDLATSSALAHAHGSRAIVYCDLEQNYPLARDDARRALEIHAAAANSAANAASNVSPPPHASYYRVLVEAEEATGNFQAALEVMRQWTDCHPKFATKVAKEAKRVRSMMGP